MGRMILAAVAIVSICLVLYFSTNTVAQPIVLFCFFGVLAREVMG